VVTEGWRELGLVDSEVDLLLTSDNLDILRRFRNGVFHYQEDYFDRRLTDLINNQDAVDWAVRLHSTIGDYFLRRFERLGASQLLDELLKEIPELEKHVHVPRPKKRWWSRLTRARS
jgi:hypothetical protein